MANRRSGGMGGGGFRGNRSFSNQPFQGSGLSPWQGSPNPMNQGLMSSPQQLAMALTSLLQPQQQTQPPSLLSLNTSPFSNQNRDFNRFGGNRGRDMRRHEPYNKNRNVAGFNRRNPNRKSSPSRDQKKKVEGKKKEEDKEVKEADAAEGDENESGEKGSKDGPYHGVPVRFLNCFVCSKEMWDGESMSKHVNGRAHKQVLDSLEESMHLTVNILREHMRITEEKKGIEWQRMQRLNKKFANFNDSESHCNMCDLKFMGKIVSHRKSEGHQRLKRYLHPNCRICDKEFPSRMDWVEHRLTPEHLRKLAKTLENRVGGADGDKILLDEEPDLAARESELTDDMDDPIYELSDDLSDALNHLPGYFAERAIATECLKQFEGFHCELCDRSFDKEELAQNHLKTRRHYYAFVDAAKSKYKEDLAKKDSEEKTKKEAPESGEQETGDQSEPSKDESAMEVTEEVEENEDEDDDVVEIKEDDVVEEVPPPAKEEPKKAVPKPVAKAEPVKPVVSKPVPAVSKPVPAVAKPVPAVAKPGPAVSKPGPKSVKARK